MMMNENELKESSIKDEKRERKKGRRNIKEKNCIKYQERLRKRNESTIIEEKRLKKDIVKTELKGST